MALPHCRSRAIRWTRRYRTGTRSVARAEAQYGGRLRDGIHVIRRDGTLMVKRLLFEREGRVSVISDNKAYPSDANVPLEEVEVLGRVVWKGGRI